MTTLEIELVFSIVAALYLCIMFCVIVGNMQPGVLNQRTIQRSHTVIPANDRL